MSVSVPTMPTWRTSAIVYDAGRRHASEIERCHAFLNALGADCASRADALIVSEMDETLVADDRRTLFRAARLAGGADSLH